MRRLLSAFVLALPLLSLLPAPSAPAAGPAGDPSTWTHRHLAAQLVLAGYDMSCTDDAIPWGREAWAVSCCSRLPLRPRRA